MWFIRAKLAMWLDLQKDRIDGLAQWIEPDSKGWEKWDAYATRRGYYDWWLKDDD